MLIFLYFSGKIIVSNLLFVCFIILGGFMIYGYARISTRKQNIERQVRNILREYPDAHIIREVYTGTKLQSRKDLQKLINQIRPGDSIVFDQVSRMSRNADEGFELYEKLYYNGIELVFLKEPHINTATYKKALETNIQLTGTNVDYILEGINNYLMALAKEQLQITLAISLHAVNDERRRELMPIARRYTIAQILDACRYYYEQTKRRITFEYSLARGVNDSSEDARALARLLKGLNCHINLIPINPVKERDFEQSDPVSVQNFKNKLEKYGGNVTIRREMGRDIQAACGQLRKSYTDNLLGKEV